MSIGIQNKSSDVSNRIACPQLLHGMDCHWLNAHWRPKSSWMVLLEKKTCQHNAICIALHSPTVGERKTFVWIHLKAPIHPFIYTGRRAGNSDFSSSIVAEVARGAAFDEKPKKREKLLWQPYGAPDATDPILYYSDFITKIMKEKGLGYKQSSTRISSPTFSQLGMSWPSWLTKQNVHITGLNEARFSSPPDWKEVLN